MSTWRQLYSTLFIMLGYSVCALLGGLAISAVVITPERPLLLALSGFVVFELLLAIGWFVLMRRWLFPRAYREAAQHGLRLEAVILAARPTGWRRRKRAKCISPRLTSHEYKLQIEVANPLQGSYSTTIYAYLPAPGPKPGQRISVKVHQQRPDIVVFDQPPAPL